MRTLIVWFSLLISSLVVASNDTCNVSPHFEQNLDRLLLLCEKLHVNVEDCDSLLDAVEVDDASTFKAKLYAFEQNHQKHGQGNFTKTNPNAPAFDLPNWKDVPTNPKKAYKQLTEFSEVPHGGFSDKIQFSSKVDMDSLNHSEIKNAYEIIEKMKSSKSRLELENYLNTKSKEVLKGSGNKACSGENVFSVRLSQGARLCFQYLPDSPNSIKILCMGHGRVCYEH